MNQWIIYIYKYSETNSARHEAVIQWYVLHWKRTFSQLKDLCLSIWTPGHKALMIKWIVEQFLNYLILVVIIRLYRQNLRGSFSDPILSSGCSCVKRHLMWHPMSVSPAKKTGVLVDDSVAKHCHSTVGCMCSMFFHVFHVLHIFHIGQTSWSSPCSDKFFSRKESSATAGWMALERLKVRWEPKGCGGSAAFGCFQPGQGEIKC